MNPMHAPQLVDADDLPEYPVGSSVRLDSHDFITWQFRRYLKSDFRKNASHEIKSIWFELVQQAHDETPVGTLPVEREHLVDLVKPRPDLLTFNALAERPYGVLYGWRRCVCDNGKVRLMHPTVTQVVIEAISRKELNASRTDGASTQKRLIRLSETLSSMAPGIAMDPAQVRWIDAHIRDAMERDGNRKRTNEQLHGAIHACIEKQRAGFFRKPPRP